MSKLKTKRYLGLILALILLFTSIPTYAVEVQESTETKNSVAEENDEVDSLDIDKISNKDELIHRENSVRESANEDELSTLVMTTWDEVQTAIDNAADGDELDFAGLSQDAGNRKLIVDGKKLVFSNINANNLQIILKNNGNITLNDANINNINLSCILAEDSTSNILTISKEVFLKSSGNGAGIGVNDQTKLTINGLNDEDILNVETEDGKSAAIGGEFGKSCGDITFSGNFKIVANSKGEAAGIGHGSGEGKTNNGNLSFKDGVSVEVSSVSGAGIGSSAETTNHGVQSDNFIININDAAINASSTSGAGIGTGSGSKYSSVINIVNSKVFAESNRGAGIGAGESVGYMSPDLPVLMDLLANAGEITIDGGTVETRSIKGSGIGLGGRTRDHRKRTDEMKGTVKILNGADVRAYSAGEGDDSYFKDSSAYVFVKSEAISAKLLKGSIPTMTSHTFRPNIVLKTDVSDPNREVQVDNNMIEFKDLSIKVYDEQDKKIMEFSIPDGYRSYAYSMPKGVEYGLYKERVEIGESGKETSIVQFGTYQAFLIIIDYREEERGDEYTEKFPDSPNEATSIRHDEDRSKFKATTSDESFEIKGSSPWITDNTFVGYPRKPVEVIYDKNAEDVTGEVPIDNIIYQKDTEVTVKGNEGNLERKGYVFTGWSTDKDAIKPTYVVDKEGNTTPSTFIITKDTTLYAIWGKTFEVTYDKNGDDVTGEVPIDNTIYQKDTEVPVKGNEGNLKREGYTFAGWNTKADGTGTSYVLDKEGNITPSIFKITEDTTLYAIWEETFEVTYDKNATDATGEVPIDNTIYQRDTEVTVKGNESKLERKGYIFTGWNTKANGTGTSYSVGDKFNITEDTTLYAQWKENEKFSIIYNGNEHTGGTVPVDLNSYNLDDAVTVLPKGDLSKIGYTFKGWNTKADGSGISYKAGDTFKITANITLYAQWKENEKFTIIYNGNEHIGGTVPVDLNSYNLDDAVTVLPKGNLSRTGYTFKGWNTKADGSGASYKAGDIFKITANTTLYAQWQKDSEDSGTGWTWSGGSSTISKESPKTEEVLTHMAYLNGYPDNTIRPQGSITRAEVAAIFARLKVGEANIPSATTKYNDVNASDWYTKYIAFVTDNKIMEGYEDGSFKPNNKITRAEFTEVVARYNSLADMTSTFEDVIGRWAAGYIGSVTNKGWINGYPDKTFKPEKDISREEVATMVNKMLDRKVDKDGLNNLGIKNFKDLDNSSWSYFDIVEASNSHKSVRRTLGDIMENWKELL